jgi:NAD(P)-dependent dehydrogenase (short-subunit alcohol dehydrogenase family)
MTRNVLVTGSSSGIGRATVDRFAAGGDKVFASMRDPAKGEDLLALAAGNDWNVSIVQLDVGDEASVDAAMESINSEIGALDVVVNNAGLGMNAAVEDATDEEVFTLFNTNVFGVTRILRRALPPMRERGRGAIVNVSSMGGHVVWPYFGYYHATKWAVEALTEALYLELQPFGIHVYAVMPGLVATNFATSSVRGSAFKNKESAYRDDNRRWIDGFVELVPENRVEPESAAEKIFEVVESGGDQLHSTSDDFAERIVSGRKSRNDEEWFAYFKDMHGLE